MNGRRFYPPRSTGDYPEQWVITHSLRAHDFNDKIVQHYLKGDPNMLYVRVGRQ